MRARRCGDRSRGEAECVSFRESDAENCDERNYDDMVHSRFVGPEIELICNHNFV
jgi:hypothetical protein